MENGDIVLLENVRFDAREEANNPEFAKELASMAELYVNDPNKVEVNNYNIHTDYSNGGNGNSSEIYSDNMKSKDL